MEPDHSASRLRDGLALLVTSLLPLGLSLVYFVFLDAPGSEANPAVQATLAGAKIVQFLIPVVYVWCFERKWFTFGPFSMHGLAVGAGFGAVVSIAMFVTYFAGLKDIPALAQTGPDMVRHRLHQLDLRTPMQYWLLALFISIVHSLLEEYYWRWFVFGWMRRRLRVSLAMVLSSIGFMLHHVVVLGVFFPGSFWTLALPFALAVAVGGGFWAWLYERSGSLYGPWISHAMIDLAIMTVGFDMLGRS